MIRVILLCASVMVVASQPSQSLVNPILTGMQVPIAYVRPQDRQVIRQKFEHFLKTRDNVVKRGEFLRYRDAIDDVLSLEKVRYIRGNLTKFLDTIPGKILYQQSVALLNDKIKPLVHVYPDRITASPAILFLVKKAINDNIPVALLAQLTPEYQNIKKNIEDVLKTSEFIRAGRVEKEFAQSQMRWVIQKELDDLKNLVNLIPRPGGTEENLNRLAFYIFLYDHSNGL